MLPSKEQDSLLLMPENSKIFLQGQAGTGKTTAGTLWLQKLVSTGIPTHQILIYVPQRTLAQPYKNFDQLNSDPFPGLLNVITFGSLARRMVDLFWPMISNKVGVAEPNLQPHFLTMETAQYYMARIVRPLIEKEGFFTSLTINRNRIYAQIIDNLNKSAIIGFPYTQISERLKSAWVGDMEQLHIYEDVQVCINLFRTFCLENNLLDYSLQVEIFSKQLWPGGLCREHLVQTYRHLIADNLEEDVPVAHDILRDWLPEFESALLIYDEDAGYRYFLGADIESAYALKAFTSTHLRFDQNQVNEQGICQLKQGINAALMTLQGQNEVHPDIKINEMALAFEAPKSNPKYFPLMVRWIVQKIAALVEQGVPPGEIVVLAPFMPDVLRFTLSNLLDEMGIPNQSHRPSRSLREEPATQTLLTLAGVAFPNWQLLPKRIDLAISLMHAIDGLDLVRAQLLTAFVYETKIDFTGLKSFETVPVDFRERITYRVGEKYDHLSEWIICAENDDDPPLDFFFSRLFGEVLSQPGFGFHQDLNSGNVIANLIESIQKFRWAINQHTSNSTTPIGKEYIQMVNDGVIAAQYVQSWERQQNAVFLSPAYTFLINNQPVDYQFWLDIGSPSWYQRLEQPLTQPYVLSRNWKANDVWDAADEQAHAYQSLSRLSIGLLNRCRKKLYVGMSELDIRGYENRGLLIRILQHVLQNVHKGAS